MKCCMLLLCLVRNVARLLVSWCSGNVSEVSCFMLKLNVMCVLN